MMCQTNPKSIQSQDFPSSKSNAFFQGEYQTKNPEYEVFNVQGNFFNPKIKQNSSNGQCSSNIESNKYFKNNNSRIYNNINSHFNEFHKSSCSQCNFINSQQNISQTYFSQQNPHMMPFEQQMYYQMNCQTIPKSIQSQGFPSSSHYTNNNQNQFMFTQNPNPHEMNFYQQQILGKLQKSSSNINEREISRNGYMNYNNCIISSKSMFSPEFTQGPRSNNNNNQITIQTNINKYNCDNIHNLKPSYNSFNMYEFKSSLIGNVPIQTRLSTELTNDHLKVNTRTMSIIEKKNLDETKSLLDFLNGIEEELIDYVRTQKGSR